MQRGSECDFNAARACHLPAFVKNFVHAFNTNRNHRDSKLGCNHANAWLERRDFAGPSHSAFGENEQAPFAAGDLADVAQCSQCAGLALRDREAVEEQRREIVVQAVRKTASVKMLFEEFLAHGGRHAITPARRQCVENPRHVHETLMIRREDDRGRHSPEGLQAPGWKIRCGADGGVPRFQAGKSATSSAGAPLSADSSSPSATMRSTRSSEVRFSSGTLRSVAEGSPGAGAPLAISWRFSLPVPSVRGNSARGQREKLRMR